MFPALPSVVISCISFVGFASASFTSSPSAISAGTFIKFVQLGLTPPCVLIIFTRSLVGIGTSLPSPLTI